MEWSGVEGLLLSAEVLARLSERRRSGPPSMCGHLLVFVALHSTSRPVVSLFIVQVPIQAYFQGWSMSF